MKLITWNIQWARGLDGNVDPARIARTARAIADFDVLCLQEVAVNFPGLEGSRGEDQVAALAQALPGYGTHFGAAVDVDDGRGGRSLLGNLVVSRLPVTQVFRHLLPWPAQAGVRSMQRLALEAVVRTSAADLRVLTTHLEYYSAVQRMAQVDALRALHEQAGAHAAAPGADDGAGSPFARRPRPLSAILTGDFNFEPGSPEYVRLTAPAGAAALPFLDAWTVAHGNAPHVPTAGVHENSWAPRPLACDFVFVTADLAPRVRRVQADLATRDSDHQPLLVELDGP
ncbi:MAG TPA: endonuclease/exonuclease/phosphatase family protein [Burkholderiales bacterium]|nr:endonuclease/exonuclease/phosphatase family protein [Burkholderiales bacterium]